MWPSVREHAASEGKQTTCLLLDSLTPWPNFLNKLQFTIDQIRTGFFW
jgi:hypothetical protein